MPRYVEIVVPEYVRAHVEWAVQNSAKLNSRLLSLCPGLDLSPACWAALAAAGAWSAGGFPPTARFIAEAVNTSTAKFNITSGNVYQMLYRSGASDAHLVEARLNEKPMRFEVTATFCELWSAVGGVTTGTIPSVGTYHSYLIGGAYL